LIFLVKPMEIDDGSSSIMMSQYIDPFDERSRDVQNS
jgi:hypothetical protein